MDYQPLDDGVTHINFYSKAKTELGKILTNMAYSPLVLDGLPFNCLEGYWYHYRLGLIITTEEQKEQIGLLKETNGFQSKALGRKIRELSGFTVEQWDKTNCQTFRADFTRAMFQKILERPDWVKLMFDSTLPFAHYYYYGEPDNAKIIADKNDFMCNVWESIRSTMKTELGTTLVNDIKTAGDLILNCSERNLDVGSFDFKTTANFKIRTKTYAFALSATLSRDDVIRRVNEDDFNNLNVKIIKL